MKRSQHGVVGYSRMPKATQKLKEKETVYSKPASPKKEIKSPKKDQTEILPEISLLDQDGQEINLSDIKSAVIFMYPKANTPGNYLIFILGCTKQACGFRDSFDKIKEKGYSVYGLSADSPKSQLNWKTKYELPFDFLCDPEYKLIKFFGALKSPKGIKRSVVVLDKGVIVLKEIQISPLDSVSKVLEFLES